MKRSSHKKNKHHKGFTLVEMIVSLGLFSVVMVMGVGSLLTMIDSNAKIQALQTSTSNLSYAIDIMTRELRTGYYYRCSTTLSASPPSSLQPSDCVNGGIEVFFKRERDGKMYGYRLSDNILQQYDGTNWSNLTSKEGVIIDALSLVVKNTDTHSKNGDTNQPYIDIFISGFIRNGLEHDTRFSVQTRAVQHRFDAF